MLTRTASSTYDIPPWCVVCSCVFMCVYVRVRVFRIFTDMHVEKYSLWAAVSYSLILICVRGIWSSISSVVARIFVCVWVSVCVCVVCQCTHTLTHIQTHTVRDRGRLPLWVCLNSHVCQFVKNGKELTKSVAAIPQASTSKPVGLTTQK